MKTTILIFSMLISLSSCSDDNTDKQDNSLIGTWQLVEFWYLYDESGPWVTVENGYTYTFNSDGSFISSINISSGCSGGKYSTFENKLTLNYVCINLDTGIETPTGTLIENYILEGEYLILTPSYLFCVEGCEYKFKRISKE